MKALQRIVVALCLLLPLAASAGFEQRDVTTSASAELIERLLDTLDIKYEKLNENAYRFEVHGKYKVVLFNKNEDIQLYAGFSMDRASLSLINDWNRSKRFSRAYLDDEDDPVLEADLDFEGGVTAEHIVRFIAIFSQSVEKYVAHIGFK